MENNLPKYITLTENNIDKDHICCAFSDKKCLAGHQNDGNTGHAFHDGVHIIGYDGSKCVHGSG